MSVPQLVVVGCPSMDRLVFDGVTVEAPGGAGFNTALAAKSTGITVGLVAAIPTHLSREIATAFGPGGLDRAGLVARDGVSPSFHISYDEHQSAHYDTVEIGVESQLTADDIPQAWLEAPFFHISPLGASSLIQLNFVHQLLERGFSGHLSVGCYLDRTDPDDMLVLELISRCSVVFMNQAEADTLYTSGIPTDEIIRCVTQGKDGVTVYSGPASTQYQPLNADLIDPTGAGDAFSGGYLGALILGEDAAMGGLAAAAKAISAWGSMGLIEPVAARVRQRVEVDTERIPQVAAALTEQAKGSSIDFCGFPFPDDGEALALDCLALATAHQYGFWYSDSRGWTEPMYAEAQGQRFKGSDYIWQAFTRAVRQDPTVLDPQRLANEPDLFEQICLDDDGHCPIPEIQTHSELQQAYGAALLAGGYGSFAELVTECSSHAQPGSKFLDRLGHMPGYGEDPLAKKANLLLIILAKRPEGFINLTDPEVITPVIDYHLMRSCLRTGCVTITDPDFRSRIERRMWVDEVEEAELRDCAFEAINRLVEISGLSQAAIDGFFFVNARKNCVEVSAPDCESCSLKMPCAQRVESFQPVIRTTFY